MIVCNSTVLIYLSKIDKLWILRDLFKKIVIPVEVKKEVVDQGKENNKIDALEIETAINEGWIQIAEAKIESTLENVGIDKGEAEVISLAYKRKASVLLDQIHARDAARLLGLNPKGTIFVLFLALKKKLINYDNYLFCLLDLLEMGFRMDQELYLDAIKLAKEFKQKT